MDVMTRLEAALVNELGRATIGFGARRYGDAIIGQGGEARAMYDAAEAVRGGRRGEGANIHAAPRVVLLPQDEHGEERKLYDTGVAERIIFDRSAEPFMPNRGWLRWPPAFRPPPGRFGLRYTMHAKSDLTDPRQEADDLIRSGNYEFEDVAVYYSPEQSGDPYLTTNVLGAVALFRDGQVCDFDVYPEERMPSKRAARMLHGMRSRFGGKSDVDPDELARALVNFLRSA